MANKYTIFKREGNKSYYLNDLYKHFPAKFDSYVEPFLGTGSVFLGLDRSIKHSFVNDHDKFIYFFFLVMSTKRGADKLAKKIEGMLMYFNFLDAYINLNCDDLITFIAVTILKLNYSLYSHSTTILLDYRSPKIKTIKKLEQLKEFYLNKLSETTITNMGYEKFLRSISTRNKDFSGHFVYCDPPYCGKDKGNLPSNKKFTNVDLENLVGILKSKNWLFAISHMDSGIEFYRSKDLYTYKVGKSVGLAKRLGKSEYISTNYKLDTYKELF